MRTHIVVPDDLVQEVDRVAGKRRRSRFVQEAIREKLSRETLGAALAGTAGGLDPGDYPEWDTAAEVAAWVESGRLADNVRLARKLRASRD